MNSKLSARKIEKHEIQILDCDGKLKDNENWMSADTSWVRGVARGCKSARLPMSLKDVLE